MSLDLFGSQSVFVPKTEGVKYAGSKLKLLPYILSEILDLDGVTSIFDGFSGTTRVSQALSQVGSFRLIVNDTSVWSEVFARCYLQATEPLSYYKELVDHLNGIPGYDGWFSLNYGGREYDQKKPFQLKNTRKLDGIRDEIDKLALSEIDKSVALTSLILALDGVDSTLGHYVAYLAKWSSRSYKDLKLSVPRICYSRHGSAKVYRGDVFDVINHEAFDLAYYDPPYGSNNEKMPPSRVRYNAYYHFWKTVVLNDRPDLFGKVARRCDSRDTCGVSMFEEFKKDDSGRYLAMLALEKLIKETKSRYILLSYSSGGRATKEDLMRILTEQGKLLRIIEVDYRKNVMSKMKWTNEWVASQDINKEYLFLLKK